VTGQQLGLVLFAAVVGLNCAGLALDAALYTEGLRTVTQFARGHAWAAAAILVLNGAGVFGLLLHFAAGP